MGNDGEMLSLTTLVKDGGGAMEPGAAERVGATASYFASKKATLPLRDTRHLGNSLKYNCLTYKT